jgi:hypothetical protein
MLGLSPGVRPFGAKVPWADNRDADRDARIVRCTGG